MKRLLNSCQNMIKLIQSCGSIKIWLTFTDKDYTTGAKHYDKFAIEHKRVKELNPVLADITENVLGENTCNTLSLTRVNVTPND